MDDSPGGWACFQWYERWPLPEQWVNTSSDFQERVLAFWIRASESDEWTFSQLNDLLAILHDSESEEIPPALNTWGIEVALGRRKVPLGRPTDPVGDARTATVEHFLTEFFGFSKRRAHQEIAKIRWPARANDGTTTGRVKIRPPGTVEASANRARRGPPGA